MDDVQVTVVINGHREGLIAAPTIRSALRAQRFAAVHDINVELLAVLDRPDVVTVDTFRAFASAGLEILKVDNGDPGPSRNAGVEAARGDWVAFLDADDLFGETWLVEAHKWAAKDDREVVWHPEVNLYFGGRQGLFRHVDMESHEFDILSLLLSNYWTALCFARRSLLFKCPYQESNLARQLGYEDWGWNVHVVEKGAIHKKVPGTIHAIRVKPALVSVNQRSIEQGCLPQPSGLFRELIARRCRNPKSTSRVGQINRSNRLEVPKDRRGNKNNFHFSLSPAGRGQGEGV